MWQESSSSNGKYFGAFRSSGVCFGVCPRPECSLSGFRLWKTFCVTLLTSICIQLLDILLAYANIDMGSEKGDRKSQTAVFQLDAPLQSKSSLAVFTFAPRRELRVMSRICDVTNKLEANPCLLFSMHKRDVETFSNWDEHNSAVSHTQPLPFC